MYDHMTQTDQEAEHGRPQFVKHFWFKPPGGGRFSHLDLTGAEAIALEKRLGCVWGDVRPVGSLSHRMAILETFLARSDPPNAASRVGAMTVQELEDAAEAEWGSDDETTTDDVEG